MKPRFASAVIALEPFVRQVFRCTTDEWRRLPSQWRGFVLARMHQGCSVGVMLEGVASGRCTADYDPQGVFDAFQGQSPA